MSPYNKPVSPGLISASDSPTSSGGTKIEVFWWVILAILVFVGLVAMGWLVAERKERYQAGSPNWPTCREGYQRYQEVRRARRAGASHWTGGRSISKCFYAVSQGCH